MTKLKVAVDIDEVLTPFLRAFVRWHNQTHQTGFKVSDFKTYRFGDTLGCPEPEAVERVLRFYQSHDFRTHRPFIDAIPALKELARRYELVIITSRHPMSREATLDWLEQHFPQTFGAVHFSTHLYLGHPLLTKTDICLSESIKILIDDNLHFAREAARKGIQVLLFGHEYNWNQAERLPAGVVRVKDWPDVVKVLLPDAARKAV